MKEIKFKTQRQRDRFSRLLPGGVPKMVRIYDNGGPEAENGSIDRYTCVFSGNYTHRTGGAHWYLAFNGAPFHPQGFGQHGETNGRCCDVVGNSWGGVPVGKKCHLGVRIRFEDLNEDGKQFVMQNYLYIWDFIDDENIPVK